MKVYIDKPTKSQLRLRQAIAFYQRMLKGVHPSLDKKSVLDEFKYKNAPEYTEAKRRVLSEQA